MILIMVAAVLMEVLLAVAKVALVLLVMTV